MPVGPLIRAAEARLRMKEYPSGTDATSLKASSLREAIASSLRRGPMILSCAPEGTNERALAVNKLLFF